MIYIIRNQNYSLKHTLGLTCLTMWTLILC